MGSGHGTLRVERIVIVDRHLRETIHAGHGEGKDARSIGIRAEVDAPDHQVLIDDFEHVIEPLPRRIEVVQQQILAGSRVPPLL